MLQQTTGPYHLSAIIKTKEPTPTTNTQISETEKHKT